MPAYQMYSYLYYEEKIKDVLKECWLSERHLEDGYDPEKPLDRLTISFQNKIMKELYDAESDDVKEEVEKHRNGEVEEDSEGDEEEMDVALKTRHKEALKRHQ